MLVVMQAETSNIDNLKRLCNALFFFFSSRRRHTRSDRDWSSDVCSSDLAYCVSRLACSGGRPFSCLRQSPREMLPLAYEAARFCRWGGMLLTMVSASCAACLVLLNELSSRVPDLPMCSRTVRDSRSSVPVRPRLPSLVDTSVE